MKIANYLRVIILVAFLGLLACSSVDDTNTAPTECVEKSSYVEVKPLTYKGHRYLWFRSKTHKGFGGVVHDPNCECYDK